MQYTYCPIFHEIKQLDYKTLYETGQLIENNKKNIFLQKLCREWGRETSSRHLFFKLKKSLILGTKQVICSLGSLYFDSTQFGYNKNMCKTLDHWSRDILNFY